MHTFFHGWRRNAGVASLVMTCVVVGMWNRSQFANDSVLFAIGGRQHQIMTSCGYCRWMSWNVRSSDGISEWNSSQFHFPALIIEYRDEDGLFKESKFPIWSFVLTLTALSAYLILWKPPKQT